MRRGSRILIVIGLFMIVAVVGLYLVFGRQPPPPPPTPTPQVIQTTKILVAIYPISRGDKIITESLKLFDWPSSQLPVPAGALTDLSKAVGKYAKTDIAQGYPIVPDMLADTGVVGIGSEAAMNILPGKVGMAFPLQSTYPEKENLPYDRRDKDVLPRLLSVAYALQPGDRVDVLACFWVYEIDKEFQARLPNKIGYINPQNPGAPVEGMAGRPAVLAGGAPGVEGPAEPQLPRMVCQLITQEPARVIKLGDWTPPAPPPATPQGGGQPAATPTPPLPKVVTLEVSPQDALVLKYARETGAQIDLVLRAAGDKDSKFKTEAVTLQYMFERFGVAVPPKLDYTIGGGGGVPIGAKNP